MYTFLSILVTYLMVGTVVTILMDKTLNDVEDADNFTDGEKAAVMLLWPVSVIVFVYGFIKEWWSGGDKK